MRINGKIVRDATKPLKISISKRDASGASRRDPGNCAAARAIIRSITDAKAARVHLGRTYIEYDDHWKRFITPKALEIEIVSFDRKTNPEYTEGDYTLGRIPPSMKLGNMRSGKSGKSGGKKRPHIARAVHQIEGVRAKGANR